MKPNLPDMNTMPPDNTLETVTMETTDCYDTKLSDRNAMLLDNKPDIVTIETLSWYQLEWFK